MGPETPKPGSWEEQDDFGDGREWVESWMYWRTRSNDPSDIPDLPTEMPPAVTGERE